MDSSNERFINEKEELPFAALMKKEPDALVISVGDTFDFKGTKFRVRKVTHKDIVCRPVGWAVDKEQK